MKQIKYGDDSFTLRCEYPTDWNAASITEVEISIATTGGVEILAATAATLYTATTLGAAAVAGDAYVELAGGAADVDQGDRFRIAESDDGDAEDVTCHHYDSSSRYLHGERELGEAHSSGAAVVPLWATYALDISDTATYTKGYELIVTWTPDTDDLAYTEHYQISGTAAATPGFWSDFEAVYPSDWERASGSNLSALEAYIKNLFSSQFKNRGMDINRIVDQDLLKAGMMLFARSFLKGRDPDDSTNLAREDWADWFKAICDNPIWQDTDQDGALDTDEEQPHGLVELRRFL